MERGISYEFKMLRVVENQPISYGWLDQFTTTLAMVAEPLKTMLVSLVYNMTIWATKNTILVNRLSSLRAGS